MLNGEIKQNSPVGEYKYDGLGKRIKKETASEYVVFVYDGLGKLIGEYSTDGPPQDPMVHYTATDPLGSPRVLTNENGAIISRRDFMPFGEEIAPETNYRTAAHKYGTGDNVRQKFTGYEHDEETGLDFAEARYYYNNHGRFTAVDPLLASGKSADPQTFNRYAYTMNRPLIFTDPTGLQSGETVNTQPEATPAQLAEQANRAMGSFDRRSLRRFNEARDNSIRMVAAPSDPDRINPCREALIANFGRADPTAALQRLNPTGGAFVVRDGEVVQGDQNVFNGNADYPVAGTTVREFFDNNPNTSAIFEPSSGYTFVDDSFNSGRGDLGRAQDLIHEAVVHQANGRRDTEFAPAEALSQRRGETEAARQARLVTEGSLEISRIIATACNNLTPREVARPREREER